MSVETDWTNPDFWNGQVVMKTKKYGDGSEREQVVVVTEAAAQSETPTPKPVARLPWEKKGEGLFVK